MRYFSVILFSLLSLLICDGVRVAINEKFIESILQNFLPEIKQYTQGTELKGSKHVSDLKFCIPNFELNKVKFTFTESGLLNININGLSPEISGRAKAKIALIKITKRFTVEIRNFRFDGNLRIASKYVNGVYVPDVSFNNEPYINFSVKFHLGGGLLNKVLEFIGNGIASIAKKFVLPAIKKQLNKIVGKVVSNLPTKIPIGPNMLDVTLSSPINLRNKFLEINSVARFYNEKIPETKTKYFPVVTFPYLTTMGSQLQIYISEFTVNSIIYTLLASNNREVKGKINTSKISNMLPGITDKFGNEVYIVFTGTPDVSLQITEQNLIVNLPGTFSVRTTGNQDIVKLDLKLALKTFVSIQNGEKVTAVVNDFDFNLNKIVFSQLSADLSVISKGFNEVKPYLLPILNEFIKSKMELTFPTVLGIKFTQLSLVHKNHYILINFNLVRK